MMKNQSTEMRKLGFENYINVLENDLKYRICDCFIGVGTGEEGGG